MQISNIILFLILISILFNKEIKLLFNTKKTDKNKKPDSIVKYEKKNPSVPHYILHYVSGHNNALFLVKLALFEMYRNNELLDFENIFVTIKKKINNYDNDNYVDSVSKEMNNYIENINCPHAGVPSKNTPPANNAQDDWPFSSGSEN